MFAVQYAQVAITFLHSLLTTNFANEVAVPKTSKTRPAVVPRKTVGRRQEYAENTREAILAAARELFSTRGYFSTTVDDIAKLARVASVTVYVTVGGKSGLLRTLTDVWSTAPIIEANYRVIVELRDPVQIMGVVASTARKIREDFGDIVILMLATAPHDSDVAESLSLATSRYKESIRVVVRHLAHLEALRNGISEEHAIDVLWFFFGYWGLYSLHVESGWDYDRAEKWLCEAATENLINSSLPIRDMAVDAAPRRGSRVSAPRSKTTRP